MIFIREHFLLVMIWVLGIFCSITSYIALQNAFPSWEQVLLGHTVYAIAAMPNAFLHMVGFYPADNMVHKDIFFWALTALYWATLGTVHYWYFVEHEPKYLIVVLLFVGLSSFKWLYFATSFIG